MPRLQLRVYVAPGQVDVFCRLRFKDGSYERLTAVIDTGAAISLFPAALLDKVERETDMSKAIVIDQAGIAGQTFEAMEAIVTIILEDEDGNVTPSFKIPAWFADTEDALLGFAGILDRSVLHIDMPRQLGWLKVNV